MKYHYEILVDGEIVITSNVGGFAGYDAPGYALEMAELKAKEAQLANYRIDLKPVEKYTMKIVFGKDQAPLIDQLCESAIKDGKMAAYEKVRNAKDEEQNNVSYWMTFDMLYHIYLFGHNQANLKLQNSLSNFEPTI